VTEHVTPAEKVRVVTELTRDDAVARFPPVGDDLRVLLEAEPGRVGHLHHLHP
jgi:hypothetical protein